MTELEKLYVKSIAQLRKSVKDIKKLKKQYRAQAAELSRLNLELQRTNDQVKLIRRTYNVG